MCVGKTVYKPRENQIEKTIKLDYQRKSAARVRTKSFVIVGSLKKLKDLNDSLCIK